MRDLRHFDLLNLYPEFIQCSVPIDTVGDITPKAMPQHALTVRFPDTVALTQPTEGMPTGVLRSLRKPQSPQCALHIPPEL